jgi:hypothetical protein
LHSLPTGTTIAHNGIAFRLRRIIAIFAESARYYQSGTASQLCLAASRFLDRAVTFERFAIVSGDPHKEMGKSRFSSARPGSPRTARMHVKNSSSSSRFPRRVS